VSKVWHIQFDLVVTDEWINDGFTLTPEILTQVIQNGILYNAYDEEKRITNVSIVESTEHHRHQRDS
jgi:hypothetical protein